MSMIAEEAGISQGLSYRYFSSKDELFNELVKQALEEAQLSVREVPHLPGTPAEQIKAFAAKMLEEEHRSYFLLLQQALTADEVPQKARQLLEQYSSEDTINQLVPVFIEGQQLGEFIQGDPRRLLNLFLSVITGLMLQDRHITGDWLQEVGLLMRIITK